jgi:hypothetical protein
LHNSLELDMANHQQNDRSDASGGNEGSTWVTRHGRWLRRAALLAAATMVSTFSLIDVGPAAVQAHNGTVHEAPVDLGSASSFGALTPAAFAATGVTSLRGDTGSNSYSFAGPENHIGTSYIGDTYATATDDFLLAYEKTATTNSEAKYPNVTIDFNAGLTLGPGWHTNGASTAATIVANATLSFDGGDHPDAVFILHVGGALTLGDGVKMVLINGAQAKNVFWHVDGSVSIGANATFVGTALAGGSIDTGANSLVNGRLLTQAGNIAMGHSSLYSAPPSVSIDGGPGDPDPFTYSVADPEISGVTSAAKVTVAIDGVTQADKPVPVGGKWTLKLDGPLSNGNHTVVATVADAIGNTGSATQALWIAAPLPVLSIDGGAVVNTADQTPTITGTSSAPAGQVVHFTLTRTERNPSDALPLVLTRTAIVQASNTWNITPNGFTGGTWTIEVQVSDLAGDIADATQRLNIAAVFAITSSALTNDSKPVITGTVEPGSTITKVTLGGSEIAPSNISVTADGFWSATTTSDLGDGTQHSVFVTARDADGVDRILAQTLTVDLDEPTITINGGANNSTDDTTPMISGTTTSVDPGTTVKVSIAEVLLTGVVQSDNTWHVTPSVDLEPQDYEIVATVNDPAGNEGTANQTLTVTGDAFVPEASLDLGSASSFGALTESSFTAGEGTTLRGDSGSSIYTFPTPANHHGISYMGDTYQAATTDFLAAYDDAASRLYPAASLFTTLDSRTFTPGLYKSDAPVAVTVTAGTTLTFDGEGHPDAVFILHIGGALTLGANVKMVLINGAQSNNVFWHVVSAVKTGEGTEFVGTVLAGAAITVGASSFVNGRLLTKTGDITIPAGSISYSAPPSVSIDGGTGVPDPVYTDHTDPSDPSRPVIAGDTSAAVVTVTVNGANPREVAAVNGEWGLMLDGPLLDGDHTVVATVSDDDGRTGTVVSQFTQIIRVDTIDPVVEIVTVDLTPTEDQFATIIGTTEVVGQTVKLSFTQGNSVFVGTAVSQADKTWNFTQKLPKGEWTVVAEVADAAGRTDTDERTLDIAEADTGGGGGGGSDGGGSGGGSDGGGSGGGSGGDGGGSGDGGGDGGGGGAVVPDTTDSTPDISGSDEAPGWTVTVVVDGQTMTTVVDDQGNWTVTVTNPLSPGVHIVTITITDPFGGTVTYTQTLTYNPTLSGSHPVGPVRVFDTRAGQSSDALRAVSKGQVSGGYVLEVKMIALGRLVPADGVGAVSLNVTSEGSRAAGYITVYDCGVREFVASVNFAAGETLGNAVIVPVSLDGTVCFYSTTPTDIVVDMNGWFARGEAFTGVGPKRVFDTRAGQSPNSERVVVKKQVSGGYVLEVKMTELGSFVPADGVGAVSLNVVSEGSGAAGYITVYDCGVREFVASVNFAAGETVGNAVIAPVSADGTVCFYSTTPTDIVVDINGWFAQGEAFTGVGPKRVFDTRAGQSLNSERVVVKKQVSGGYVLEVKMTELGNFVPTDGVVLVSLNVTSEGSGAAGYITVYDCGVREFVASVNFAAGETVGNAVIAPVSAGGSVCFYSTTPTDIVVDINGWFAGYEEFAV